MHLGQEYLAERFQEFSSNFGMFSGHETELVRLEQIEKVPVTMVFGGKDTLSDFDFQKEMLYKIPSMEGVHFLPEYDHYSFMGHEVDSSMQALVLKALNGNPAPSDDRWLSFVEQKKAEESEARR